MKKSATLALLLCALFAPLAETLAQTRPRRVGQGAPATAGSPAPRPTPAAPRQHAPQEEAGEEVGEDEVVRVNTALVTIPVSVLDRDGRFIPGLTKQDFRIQEDGVEQEVAYFATVEQPFTVALLLDTSGSTRFRLEDIQDAAIAFLDQLRPDDRVIVISFDDDVRVLSDATSDRRRLREAIRRTRTGEGTRLYDAVDLVIHQQLSRVTGRKAIVLFTDGVDTTSKRASFQSTLADAEELDALIYPVQYDTYASQAGGGTRGGGNWPGQRRRGRRSRKGEILADILGGILTGGNVRVGGGGNTGGGGGGAGSSPEDYRRGGEYLRRLAQLTGGRHHSADDLRYLAQAFGDIAEELRRQYSLGYYPSRQSQVAERRQIRVRVRRPNLVVRARDSYVYRPAGSAPADSTAQDNAAPRQAPILRPRQFDGRAGTR
ncbi:MAG TPA: VWA domain-containing protein [Pyrinomonadaceae bacterium]|nr:VWA domain-containing protein [Pyrinomonadaceae bacterium]